MNGSHAKSVKSGDLAAEARASLCATGWLADCPADFREAMLDAAIVRLVPRGQVIFQAGDDTGGLFAIASGTAELALFFEHPDSALVHLVHAGFWAGYRPLIGRHRLLSVTAHSNLLWLLVPRHAVQGLLRDNPGWWRHIAELADNGVEVTMGIVADLTRQNNVSRVAAVLLRLAGCRMADPPAGSVLTIHLSQSDLAGVAVMSRNTLNGILQQLAAEGHIDLGYRSLTILAPGRLRALLDD